MTRALGPRTCLQGHFNASAGWFMTDSTATISRARRAKANAKYRSAFRGRRPRRRAPAARSEAGRYMGNPSWSMAARCWRRADKGISLPVFGEGGRGKRGRAGATEACSGTPPARCVLPPEDGEENKREKPKLTRRLKCQPSADANGYILYRATPYSVPEPRPRPDRPRRTKCRSSRSALTTVRLDKGRVFVTARRSAAADAEGTRRGPASIPPAM
jgi:hypothetical protein